MTPRLRKANAAFIGVPEDPLLEQNRKSGTYYVRKTETGRPPLFKSLRTKNLKVASKRALEDVTAWKNRAPGLKPQRLTFGELCELAFEECKEEHETLDEEGRPARRDSTFEKDRIFKHTEEIHGKKRPGKLQALWGDLFPDGMDELWWKNEKKRLRKQGIKRFADIAKHLSYVLDYAHRNKYIGRKPELVARDKHKNRSVVYKASQIRTFWQHAESDLRDLIVINSENPLRPLETPKLPWDMVHFERDRKGRPIVILRLEGWLVKNAESERELQVSPNASEVFHRRQRLRNPASPFVFPSPKDPMKPMSRKLLHSMWRRMLKKAGLASSGFLFKWLRHTLYTQLLVEKGLPVAAVSAVGGTSMATLSKHYLNKSARRTAKVGKAVRHTFQEEEE